MGGSRSRSRRNLSDALDRNRNLDPDFGYGASLSIRLMRFAESRHALTVALFAKGKGMRHISSLILILFVVFPAHADPAERWEAPPIFEQLLAESGMELAISDGFAAVEVRPNARFIYDRAYASPDWALEIRYAIRPLRRIRVDYEDPHSAAPDPNHMLSLIHI